MGWESEYWMSLFTESDIDSMYSNISSHEYYLILQRLFLQIPFEFSDFRTSPTQLHSFQFLQLMFEINKHWKNGSKCKYFCMQLKILFAKWRPFSFCPQCVKYCLTRQWLRDFPDCCWWAFLCCLTPFPWIHVLCGLVHVSISYNNVMALNRLQDMNCTAVMYNVVFIELLHPNEHSR